MGFAQKLLVFVLVSELGLCAANNATNGTTTTTTTTTATTTSTYTTTTTTLTSTTLTTTSVTSITMTTTDTNTTTLTSTTLTNTTTSTYTTTSSVTMTDTMTMTTTKTDTVTVTVTDTMTATTTIMTTMGEIREIVKGILKLAVDNPEAFVEDANVKAALKEGIAQSAGITNTDWITLELLVSYVRRLVASSSERRLAAGKVLVSYSIAIPATADATTTGSSLASTLNLLPESTLLATIKAKVENAVGATYGQIGLLQRNKVTTETPGGTTPTSSWATRAQAVFTAAPVVAFFVGQVLTQ